MAYDLSLSFKVFAKGNPRYMTLYINRYVLQIIKTSINSAWWKNEMGLKYIATARTPVNYIYSYTYDIH